MYSDLLKAIIFVVTAFIIVKLGASFIGGVDIKEMRDASPSASVEVISNDSSEKGQ